MTNKLKFLFFILRPLGYVYSLSMYIRSYLFTSEYINSEKINVPVISVGNLTMGGSGKTPVVIYLAQLLNSLGIKSAVISRGYKGKANNSVNIVSDGKNILLSSENAGDEPRMIAELLPGTVVLTGRKRVEPSRYAVQQYNCDAIILDDGFQHIALQRDIDIVLFNGSELYNHFNVFPGGMLRESYSALSRASCVCITGSKLGSAKNVKNFTSFLTKRFPLLPIFQLEIQVKGLRDCAGKKYRLDFITEHVVAFCGIASPDRFKKTLTSLSIELSEFLTYPDHMKYSAEKIHQLEKAALTHGAKYLVTTEKDLVKLRNFECNIPILALSVEIKNNPDFDNFLGKHLNPKPTA